MRLRTGGTVAEIPVAPAASLAVLLILLAGLSGVLSARQGLRIRFQGEASRVALPVPERADFLSVLPDASLVLDGEPVAHDRLLARLAAKLGRTGSRPLVLHVSDDAPYRTMVELIDLLSWGDRTSGFRVRRLLVPTHSEIRDWSRALGRDPFGPQGGSEEGDRP